MWLGFLNITKVALENYKNIGFTKIKSIKFKNFDFTQENIKILRLTGVSFSFFYYFSC
jgi:hypothetical protein